MWGDHDELEIFLEICLIPSRIDQKLKNKEEIHGSLKGKLAQKLWAVDAFMGAILWGRGSDSLGQCRGSRICGKFASIFASKGPRSRYDRATIASRSSHDRASIMILIISQSPSDQVGESSLRFRAKGATIAARSHRDRGSIAPRLWSSSTSFLRR